MAGNHDDVYLFHRYYAPGAPPPKFFDVCPASVVACVHAERTKDLVPDGFPDLLAVLVDRLGGGCHYDFDGHDDAATRHDFAAIQVAAVSY